MRPEMLFALLLVAAVAVVAAVVWVRLQALRRAEFIRGYQWPRGLLDSLAKHHPDFTRKESALVANGLRQFFLAYHMGKRRPVSMPSQVVDHLWHEFILYTEAYRDFCLKAFGGYLHHTPAAVMNPARKASNEGLRRVWFQCCKQESIDPRHPTRLPLLFALDTKFNIPGGYRYVPDCGSVRRSDSAGTQCGAHFSSSSVDGSTEGFGDSDSGGGGSDGGGDGGGGCGGGGGGD